MEISVISKAELRERILEQRKALDETEKNGWDLQIFKKTAELGLEAAGTLYAYASVRGETETGALIDWYLKQGARVALPRVEITEKGKQMRFYYIASKEDLVPGYFGIPEPDKTCRPADCPTAPVLVPGVAFSENLSRMGYGGGFYDRFLGAEPQHRKIGLCYEFQMQDKLECGPHDIGMDLVVTQDRILKKQE